jgi:hypothetical protein
MCQWVYTTADRTWWSALQLLVTPVGAHLWVLHEQLQGIMVCVFEEGHPPCKDMIHHHPCTPHVTLLPRPVTRHFRGAVAHGAKCMADLQQQPRDEQ